MTSNFNELISHCKTWNVDDETLLIQKLKAFTEDYQNKCGILSNNIQNFSRNLSLLEVDFYNSMNSLKTMSGNKFIEHVIDEDEVKPIIPNDNIKPNYTNEEMQNIASNNLKNAMMKSLEFINFKEQQRNLDNNNQQEDDNSSVASSKIMGKDLGRIKGLKLPDIIGTKDFNDNVYIGLNIEENNENEELKNEINKQQISGDDGETEIILDGSNLNNNNNNINNNNINNNNINNNNINNNNVNNNINNNNNNNNNVINVPIPVVVAPGKGNIPIAPPIPPLVINKNNNNNNRNNNIQVPSVPQINNNNVQNNNVNPVNPNIVNQPIQNIPPQNQLSFTEQLKLRMGGGQSKQINNQNENNNIQNNNIPNIPPVMPKADPSSLAGMLFTKSTSSNKKPTSLEQALIGLDDDIDEDEDDPLFKTNTFMPMGNMFGNMNLNKPKQNINNNPPLIQPNIQNQNIQNENNNNINMNNNTNIINNQIQIPKPILKDEDDEEDNNNNLNNNPSLKPTNTIIQQMKPSSPIISQSMRHSNTIIKKPIIDMNTEKEKEKSIKLANAHKKFNSLFDEDDDEDDSEIQTGKIALNTKSLNEKLNKMISGNKKQEPIKQPIIQPQINQTIKQEIIQPQINQPIKQEIIKPVIQQQNNQNNINQNIIQQPVKKQEVDPLTGLPIQKKKKTSNINNLFGNINLNNTKPNNLIIPNNEKQKPKINIKSNFFNDDEEEIKPQKKEENIIEPPKIEIKNEEKKEEKPKIDMFKMFGDVKKTEKKDENLTNNTTNTIIQNTEEKKDNSIINSTVNQSKMSNLFGEKKQENTNNTKPIITNSNSSSMNSRIANLSNFLGSRMSVPGQNIFVMGDKKLVKNENENNEENEEKKIEGNDEENKIESNNDDIKIDNIEEKKNEENVEEARKKTVIVKKKKPKKMAFGSHNNDNNTNENKQQINQPETKPLTQQINQP